MRVLTINSGSTSIKFKLFDMPEEKVLAFGKVEEIGRDSSRLSYHTGGYKEENEKYDIPDHKAGLGLVIEKLSSSEYGVIREKSGIEVIGHRVVNIGERASLPMVIDNIVINFIEECIDLAPLHNPHNLLGIKVCRDLFGENIINVAVFDNTFHKYIPEEAYLYGIPYEFYENYKIRKYGFHGIAYSYMIERAAKILNRKLNTLKIIALMLGGGSSAAAVRYGKSIDTSMGFTPTEGLIMSTRCGDIDPAVITYIMKKENISTEETEELINKKSGLYGLSQKYIDFKDIEKGVMQKDKGCIRAFNSYCYRIKKYIGSYIAAMNGVDIIVFGGGIGENSSVARNHILDKLDFFGIYLDKQKNKQLEGEGAIDDTDSKVNICVVRVDEELVIARESYCMIKEASFKINNLVN